MGGGQKEILIEDYMKTFHICKYRFEDAILLKHMLFPIKVHDSGKYPYCIDRIKWIFKGVFNCHTFKRKNP